MSLGSSTDSYPAFADIGLRENLGENLNQHKIIMVVLQSRGFPCVRDLSAELSQKLQCVNNVCVRFIFNIRRHDHISEYFLRLSWLRLQDRRLVHSLCLLYRIIHDSTPNYLTSRFTLLASHHNRNTRSQHNLLLSIPRHQTSLYSSSFSIAMALSWNSLPLEIKGSLSPQLFKISLV
ncbi:hypothetical protein ANN_05148 [Periplaneta americana]|uniref:Uncharacterized protein n=1 Tax=Periplaneta americana TaxID=6978 RepID=A0ABQ8TBZ3_PERAM|nr:hypothetical protein ANN_05148 [Periplaneta americana]